MEEIMKGLLGNVKLGDMAKQAQQDQKDTKMALYAMIQRLTEIRDILTAIQELLANVIVPYGPEGPWAVQVAPPRDKMIP